jgi:hypothetical protein
MPVSHFTYNSAHFKSPVHIQVKFDSYIHDLGLIAQFKSAKFRFFAITDVLLPPEGDGAQVVFAKKEMALDENFYSNPKGLTNVVISELNANIQANKGLISELERKQAQFLINTPANVEHKDFERFGTFLATTHTTIRRLNHQIDEQERVLQFLTHGQYSPEIVGTEVLPQ